MTPRFKAIVELSKTSCSRHRKTQKNSPSETIGSLTFSYDLMRKFLPEKVYTNLINTYDGKEKLNLEYGDIIATALKDWAISLGATHYCHWFQPFTGSLVGMQNSFIDQVGPFEVIDQFTGTQLAQGKAQATYLTCSEPLDDGEANCYKSWDSASLPFIWKNGDCCTLCLPSVFYSSTGAALDYKIPLLRSEKKISDALLHLLKLTKVSANFIIPMMELEQEYFIVDRTLHNIRPDLVVLGGTLFGAASPKEQEASRDYLDFINDRILFFMKDFEEEAVKLAIPIKTHHNKIAPSQYKVSLFLEKCSTALDHNILLMELMHQTAEKHGLCCLLHEKPFQGLNGSGKHLNWSLITDSGINLLDPAKDKGEKLYFLILLTAIFRAIHLHGDLLAATLGSAHNDLRLGEFEAPPSAIFIYLNKELEKVLSTIESKGLVGVNLPNLRCDNSDGGRAYPIAFIENKLKIQGLGSAATPGFTAAVLNSIIADSLEILVKKIEDKLSNGKDFVTTVGQVVGEELRESKKIRFSSAHTFECWEREILERKLPSTLKSIYSFDALLQEKAISVLEKVLSSQELYRYHDILQQIYSLTVDTEIKIMIEMFIDIILPIAVDEQKNIANSLNCLHKIDSNISVEKQKQHLNKITALIETGLSHFENLKKLREETAALTLKQQGHSFCDTVIPEARQLRNVCDKLEVLLDDRTWPLPKYRELLYIL